MLWSVPHVSMRSAFARVFITRFSEIVTRGELRWTTRDDLKVPDAVHCVAADAHSYPRFQR